MFIHLEPSYIASTGSFSRTYVPQRLSVLQTISNSLPIAISTWFTLRTLWLRVAFHYHFFILRTFEGKQGKVR